MKPEDLLFALDGILGQCATAKQAYLAEGASVVPIDSIFAATAMLRMVVENAAEKMMSASPDDGKCYHPADQVKRTIVGGGNWILTCLGCNEIIEQSS